MQTTPSENNSRQSNYLSSVNCKLSTNTLGRTELAQLYFPYILPKSAWEKLRALLAENPDLAPLTRLKRRTFLPAEVNIIYQHIGQP